MPKTAIDTVFALWEAIRRFWGKNTSRTRKSHRSPSFAVTLTSTHTFSPSRALNNLEKRSTQGRVFSLLFIFLLHYLFRMFMNCNGFPLFPPFVPSAVRAKSIARVPTIFVVWAREKRLVPIYVTTIGSSSCGSSRREGYCAAAVKGVPSGYHSYHGDVDCFRRLARHRFPYRRHVTGGPPRL